MSRMMKALVKTSKGAGLSLIDMPLPAPGAEEVIIKISKTGICGTDLHIWNWDEWAAKTIPVPLTIGHEFSGEIAELGSEVRNLQRGQRVSGEGHLIGDKSRAVRAGRFHLDPETRGIGINVPGAYAQYLKLPAFNVVPLPDEIDDETGAILDPLGNAVHTALSFDLVGEDVLITGAGPIGIMAACVARHVGARHIVITDVNPDRLDLAGRVCDAIPVNINQEDLKTVMDTIGLREGFDVGLEMSGAHNAFNNIADVMVMGGHIAILGIPDGESTIDWSKVALKALTIKGIYGREIFETWYKMISLLQNGLNVRKIITHRLPANDYEKGFSIMSSGQCGKVVMDWLDVS
ncbi:MAG: L-threonine 3-dehydrogenase [Methyloligellaceae bacterium]